MPRRPVVRWGDNENFIAAAVVFLIFGPLLFGSIRGYRAARQPRIVSLAEAVHDERGSPILDGVFGTRWVRIRNPRWRCNGVLTVGRHTLVPIGVEDDVDVYAEIGGRCSEWVHDKTVRGLLVNPWGQAQDLFEQVRGPGKYLVLEVGDQSGAMIKLSLFSGAFLALGVFLLFADPVPQSDDEILARHPGNLAIPVADIVAAELLAQRYSAHGSVVAKLVLRLRGASPLLLNLQSAGAVSDCVSALGAALGDRMRVEAAWASA